MKKAQKRIIAIVLIATLVVTGIGAMVGVVLADNEKKVNIAFTSDMHSNLNSYVTPYHGKEGTNIGGFARVSSIINEERAKHPDLLYIDGGDFSMGTLFHTLYETQAVELRLLGAMGCDVTTWGNHEFNFGSEGIRKMLTAAMNSGDKLPQMVECNIDWSNPGDEQSTKDVFDKYGIKKYTMINKGGVNIAVIGVFGDNALACEPTCTINFMTGDKRIQAVKDTVAEIKKNENADISGCGYVEEYSDHSVEHPQKYTNDHDEMMRAITLLTIKGVMWKLLVRSTIVTEHRDEVRFIPDRNMVDDYLFCCQIFYYAKRFACVDCCMYHWIQYNPNNYTHTTVFAVESQAAAIRKAEEFYRRKGVLEVVKDSLLQRKFVLKLPLLLDKNCRDVLRWRRLFPEAHDVWREMSFSKGNKCLFRLAQSPFYWLISLLM